VTLTVVVVGAGLGGLCLAQGLRRAGVTVRVFERDATARTRRQGFRLRMDPDGISALNRCLPPELFRLFLATSSPPHPPRGSVFDHNLVPIAPWATPPRAEGPRRLGTAADRATLRDILLGGLDDVVEFGRELIAVQDTGDGVVARFADGSTAGGDVLVGADGINSVVRAHLLPHARVLDTGLRGVYGHATLDPHLLDVLPDVLLSGSPPVLAPNGITVAIGAFRPAEAPERAAARIAPYVRLRPVADYVKWTLVASPTVVGPAGDGWAAASSSTLLDTARRITADWHPAVAELMRCTDPPSTFPVAIRAALPVDPWPSRRVTLLGDAVHATTPAGGTGANVALRDAAELTGYLTAADRGATAVLDAIATYEDRMRDYGFAAAARSLRSAELVYRARLPAPA
jgi:2-polyprenyl-6-methoxyphenol hydroxylase-like FAD-dependent oxidoreductase